MTSDFGYAGPSQDERTSNAGTAQRNNVLGLSGQGTTNWTRGEGGGLVSQRASSAKHYYLTDALGSITALTDSSGNVAQTYMTDPYGNATGGTGTVSNPWQFAGEYRDPAANANLYKIGARNYDPTIGRWTQQDPLDQPDDLQNANTYLYAASDPVNLVDPSGTRVGFPDLDGPITRIVRKRYKTNVYPLFKDSTRTARRQGQRAVKVLRGNSYARSAQGFYNCGKQLAGRDIPAGCDPLGNTLLIEDAE